MARGSLAVSFIALMLNGTRGAPIVIQRTRVSYNTWFIQDHNVLFIIIDLIVGLIISFYRN
ncbi:uncharacterized protein BKA55DRAFT_553219 [Fusarium redolens]|uniref:Uncharacterized protein n=1 Tax=Fusarium redolens TaxID=48865 RepID=A0A9P9KQV2_FUSRE|nr:uncharacterized protein BKA55DRAFT_553219 [Fusarium redolens]KAH7266763.1 hypothetical protein BKA55DRAFT_553219 [Fusarium redolens]